jgi:hypothetical protein
MAGVAIWVALQISPDVPAPPPKWARRLDLGHNLTWPNFGSIDVSNGVFCDLLLFFGCLEARGAVAGPDIVSLPV